MSQLVSYQSEPRLSVNEFVSILERSTLGERRPVEDVERLILMIENSDVLKTARTEDGLLIGVSRAITDFSYCAYLSDLAVDVDYQRQGVGQELIRQTHQACGLQTRLVLLAAPAAHSFYPHIGFEKHESCWTLAPYE